MIPGLILIGLLAIIASGLNRGRGRGVVLPSGEGLVPAPIPEGAFIVTPDAVPPTELVPIGPDGFPVRGNLIPATRMPQPENNRRLGRNLLG